MTKKIILIVSGVVLGIALFVGGFFCGLKFFDWSFSVSNLTKARIELMQLQMNIEQLDRKDYDALHTSLNIRQDAEIIRVYNILDEATNKEDIDKAKKTLSRIAKHRKVFPAAYAKYPESPDTDKVQKSIVAILAEFIDYK